MTRYRIVLTATGKRDLDRLPEKIAAAAIEFMFGPLAENPQRGGKRLDPPLHPKYVARRGEYRVIYDIHGDVVEVEVVAIKHRRDAYRPR
ncbi:MAG: type II toxin-antitoxin system RelE/ParE family toxin [Schumannella sp.]